MRDKFVRTRLDWARFGVVMFAASTALGAAVTQAVGHAWGSFALFGAVGISFVVLAFMTISTNPRIRRRVSWDVLRSREAGPR